MRVMTWVQIYDRFLAKLAPLSGGTFRAELLDVTLGERFVVAVQHATAALDGRILDVTGCQLMEITGGRISRVRGDYSDQEGLDSFLRGAQRPPPRPPPPSRRAVRGGEGRG